MKNILVYDVAASETGALSVLKDFYNETTSTNAEIKWVFIVSTPELSAKDNVIVLRYPWVKKSWLHRIWFEQFIAPVLAKKHRADLVFSLQNVIVPHTKVPQILYVHQSLPFAEYRFKLREQRLFWIYQNIIGKKIIESIRRARKVIVQTNWMKEACVHKAAVSNDKVAVIPPYVSLDNIPRYIDALESRKVFFYPAGPFSYKNHMLILKACVLLKQRGITDYKVIFTLTGHENTYSEKLFAYAKQEELNIVFMGAVSREDVFSLYSTSVLIFTSVIETFGLPMLEARRAGAIIIALDMPFSREVLDGYHNAHFCSDDCEITEIMAECLDMKIEYTEVYEHFNKESPRITDILLKMI